MQNDTVFSSILRDPTVMGVQAGGDEVYTQYPLDPSMHGYRVYYKVFFAKKTGYETPQL
jgi:hypothetical protein